MAEGGEGRKSNEMGYIPAMPDYLPGTAPSDAAVMAPIIEPAGSKGRFVVAGLLSAIVPGVGHFLIDRRIRGLVFFAGFVALFLLYWLLRLPQTIYGATLPVFGTWILGITSTVDAAYASSPYQMKPSQWWLALLLPAVFVSASAHSSWQLRVTGFRPFIVPASSMAPTIPQNGHIMVDWQYYQHRTPQRGEIVVAMSPTSPGVYIVKRVIAVADDTIRVRGDDVFLNGNEIKEPYVALEGDLPNVLQSAGPITLPSGKLFIMGDNRHVSLDSRAPQFGLVDVSALRGKVIYPMPSWSSDFKWKDLAKRLDTERAH